MKPFNLEAAMRGDPIVCRDGRLARFVAYVPDADETERLVVLVDGGIYVLHEDGQYVNGEISFCDLFMAPKKQTLWINIYPDSACVYHSEQEANMNANPARLYGRAYQVEVEV